MKDKIIDNFNKNTILLKQSNLVAGQYVTLHLEQIDIVPDLMKTMDKKLNKKKHIFQDDSEDERITILD